MGVCTYTYLSVVIRSAGVIPRCLVSGGSPARHMRKISRARARSAAQ